MVASAAAKAATKIPWKQLIILIPDVVKTAKSVWKQWDSKPKPEPIDPTASINSQVSAISKRIQDLESNETNQSKLVSEIAEQLQVIATGLRETANRQIFIMWLSVGAAIISACSLALSLVK